MDPRIAPDDPARDDVRSLLAMHLAYAHEHSAPEDVYALDVTGLLDPAVSFVSLRVDDAVLAVGALRALDADHAELKSMHTAATARGRGFGRAMVDHLLPLARSRGFRRCSLPARTGAARRDACRAARRSRPRPR